MEESDGGRFELTFSFEAVRGTTLSGSGSISPGPCPDESTINLQLQGLPARSIHALTQHHGKSIHHLDSAPEFIFSAVTADSQGKAAAVVHPKKPFWRWANRPHFIVVHLGPGVDSPPFGCGMITATPAEVGLVEADHDALKEHAEAGEGRGGGASAAWPAAESASRLRLVKAGGPGSDAGPGPLLTSRENEILDFVAAGMSNPEIAAALVISVKTVERHISNIYGKIGTHNRVGAANYARRGRVE